MSNDYFSSASDAGSFMIKLLSNDYFQDFSHADRIQDPDGIYAIEAEMTHSYASADHDAGDYYWDDQEREALTLFAEATPAERAEIFELWG
jgi:hypothetical protein